MDASGVFAGLNPEQRRAVEAVRGPVCILAGAGSGKTTTITRRIANQVLTGAFSPSQILAVTFTDKAAGELRARLARLGVTGVPARTFHAAALAQLHHFAPESTGSVLPSKALLVKQSAGSLPRPFRFRPLADLANEIEWAKNRRLTPATYLEGLGEHEPPIPPDLMAGVFTGYERRKEARDLVDFEDLLELAVRLFDEDERARETFRARYHAFTVDEYQDVNLLQQSLLERWLGERDDLCSSATTTSRSTRSRARRPSTSSRCHSGFRTRRWSVSSATTARRRRSSSSRTGSCRCLVGPRKC